VDALGAMAQGLFASLLIGTIIKTLGQQTGLETLVDLGGYATAMSGPAMACAIGWAEEMGRVSATPTMTDTRMPMTSGACSVAHKAAITPMDWAAMILLCFVLPAVLSVVFCENERKLGWIKDGDLKLDL